MGGEASYDLSRLQTDLPSQGHRAYHTQYGQVTPPDDHTTPKAPESAYSLNGEEESGQEVSSRRASKTKSKRGSVAAIDAEEMADFPKKARRVSKGRKDSAVPTAEPEEEQKREKFLERNRIAASKCRQKKKEWTNNLEQRARELTQERATLTSYVASLKDELLYLKGECLKHTDCNCVDIRRYLTSAVAHMTTTSPELYSFSNLTGRPDRAMSVVSDSSRGLAHSQQSSAHTRHNSFG